MKILDWIFNRKTMPKVEEHQEEFTFIWYKKMVTMSTIAGSTTHYTQPFRTKVKGKNREDAKEKLIKFVLGKMTLQIFEEKDFNKDELNILNNRLKKISDDFSKTMDSLFK